MTYWLDCFTGTTWTEFRKAGGTISGFNQRHRKQAEAIQPGDILLCYMIGVMRWVGALEVIGPSKDRSRIWKDAEFPVRFEVKPLFVLEPEHGIPMDVLAGKVFFYSKPEHKGKFDGFVRRSPNRFKKPEDAALIMTLLEKAQTNPVARPVDPRKLAQKPYFTAELQKGKNKETLLVSVPESVLVQPELEDWLD